MSSRVLFFCPFGSYGVHHQLDAIVALTLRMRGHETAIVRCDGIFPGCDVLAWSADKARACAECALTGQNFFQPFHLPILQLRDFISEEEREEIRTRLEKVPVEDLFYYSMDGYPLGQWAVSSVFTYHRIGEEGLKSPYAMETLRKFMMTVSITLKALSRILDSFNPDAMSIFNGRVAPYRAAFELAKERNIRYLSHERGFIDDSFVLCDGRRASDFSVLREIIDMWADVPLRIEELLDVKRYLTDRELGKGMNSRPFNEVNSAYDDIRPLLDIPAKARIFSILASSEFEVSLEPEYLGGALNQLELCRRTIEIFKNRPDDYLVIRHHPHVGNDAMTNPDFDFLTECYRQLGNLSSNVRIVMPGESVNSYALLWNSTACFCPLSTMVIESISRGIPTGVFRESTYRSISPWVIEGSGMQYLNTLVDILFNETVDIKLLTRGFRYIDSMMHKVSIKFKSFGIRDIYYSDIRVKAAEDLHPGFDPVLDRVCDYLTTGGYLHETPPFKPPQSEEELAFISKFKDECASIRHRQATIEAPRQDIHSILVISDHPFYETGRQRPTVISTEEAKALSSSGRLSSIELIQEVSASVSLDPAWFKEGAAMLRKDPKMMVAVSPVFTRLKGRICGEFNTRRQKNLTIAEQLPQLGGNGCNPEVLMSLCLWRKEEYLKIKELLAPLSREAANQKLIEILSSSIAFWNPYPFCLLDLDRTSA